MGSRHTKCACNLPKTTHVHSTNTHKQGQSGHINIYIYIYIFWKKKCNNIKKKKKKESNACMLQGELPIRDPFWWHGMGTPLGPPHL